jgi:alanyl aminopeptidase
VAIAVGPLQIVPIGKGGLNKTEIRMAAPSGQSLPHGYFAGLSGQALPLGPFAVPGLLEAAERYFGMPFPFPKLDVVGVPDFGWDAIENAGLIMVDLRHLEDLQPESNTTYTLAHELTHHWIGNYMTCAWFDDVWLNEGLTEALAIEVTTRTDAPNEWDLAAARRRALLREIRGRGATIRLVPRATDGIIDSFHTGMYARGATLVRMLQTWMGAQKFQTAITSYLARHPWGNVTTADFAASLSQAAGSDLRAVLTSFLDQPGVPLIDAETICDPGRPPRLRVAQQPLLAGPSRTWRIPMCASYDNQRECTIFDGVRTELELPRASGCPLVQLGPSADRLFFVRPNLPITPAAVASLSSRQRVDLLDEMRQLLMVGAISAAETLRSVPALLKGADHGSLLEIVELLSEDIAGLVPDELRPNWRRYLGRIGLSPHAQSLGMADHPTDYRYIRELRHALHALLAAEAADSQIIAEARKRTLAWMAQPRDEESWILALAAIHGDRPLFETLRTRAATTVDKRRMAILAALTTFQDTALSQLGIKILIDERANNIETIFALRSARWTHRTRALAWQTIMRDYQPFLASTLPYRGGEDLTELLLSFAATRCEEAETEKLTALFGKDERLKERARDELAACLSLRHSQRAGVQQFLVNE